MKIPIILFLLTMSFLAHGQDTYQFETFNGLLNLPTNRVVSELEKEFDVKDFVRLVKNSDSVRFVFRSKKPKRTYTLFLVRDTLRYIGITFFKVPTSDLTERLSTQYTRRALAQLEGDIFENYSNETHIAETFFTARDGKIGYLSVVYPKLGAKHSHVVIWRRQFVSAVFR